MLFGSLTLVLLTLLAWRYDTLKEDPAEHDRFTILTELFKLLFQEYINFLSIHDPTCLTTSGFQQLNSISVWSRTGRIVLTAQKYMELVQVCKPDLYVALCDGDTNINSSAKRVAKAITRSKTLLEQCLDIHLSSDTLRSRGILGSVEGGYNLQARKESIEYLKDKALAGFVIDGLHNNGPDVQNIPSEQVKEIIQHTIVSRTFFYWDKDGKFMYITRFCNVIWRHCSILLNVQVDSTTV